MPSPDEWRLPTRDELGQGNVTCRASLLNFCWAPMGVASGQRAGTQALTCWLLAPSGLAYLEGKEAFLLAFWLFWWQFMHKLVTNQKPLLGWGIRAAPPALVLLLLPHLLLPY